MTETVTDVIVARARDVERLSPMVAWSVVAHVVVLAAAVVIPMLGEPAVPPVRMTVVLQAGAPAPGPNSGGRTPIGGRPIQQVAPTEAPRVATPPPAPEPPKMVEPKPEPKPRPPAETRKPPVEPPKPEATPAPAVTTRASTSKPSTGEEIRTGSTPVETPRPAGPGFGLSTGGGQTGSGVRLDVGDFCCPEYIVRIKTQIESKWNHRGERGTSVVKFTIRRDGTVEDVHLDERSGSYPFDAAAQRAVLLAGKLPPLPGEFTNPTLTVFLTFRN